MARKILTTIAILGALLSIGCTRSAPGAEPWRVAGQKEARTELQSPASTTAPTARSARAPGQPVQTPTPNSPLILPTPRLESEEYIVQPNDTLGTIAQRYGVDLMRLIEENNLANPNLLEVGQMLVIPAPQPLPPGPSFKVIPDSELVYGPGSAEFELAEFIGEKNGYLNRYTEELEGQVYDSAGIIQRVAKEYSVNPRLLLAILEYRSGWVTKPYPAEESLDYPIQYFDARRQGLYRQLAWAANSLNFGFYIWRAGGLPGWVLQDGQVVPVNPTINAGTAGVQHFFSQLLSKDDWDYTVGEKGIFATYNELFGYPFDFAVEPLIPENLVQPVMQLPFEMGDVWTFTGGPHGGWASGSGWAAIDFAPPGPPLGCVQHDEWVTAVADGLIVRSESGAVVQDLDGDGFEQTGWSVLYMHMETRDRVPVGTYLNAGDRVGHPSCEGGVSTGTHLHLARRYNGEWIPADGSLPFNLDGWVSQGDGAEYNGFLVKDGAVVEAWEGRRDENQISR